MISRKAATDVFKSSVVCNEVDNHLLRVPVKEGGEVCERTCVSGRSHVEQARRVPSSGRSTHLQRCQSLKIRAREPHADRGLIEPSACRVRESGPVSACLRPHPSLPLARWERAGCDAHVQIRYLEARRVKRSRNDEGGERDEREQRQEHRRRRRAEISRQREGCKGAAQPT